MLCALIVWAGVSLLSQTPFWHQTELAGYDLLNIADPLDVAETPIVVVAIDEPSFADRGTAWPWPRSTHAALLDALAAGGAAAVAFDVVFSEPTRSAEDQALADAIGRSKPVLLASTSTVIRARQATTRMRVTPLPLFVNAGAGVGDVSLPLDADGVVRRVPDRPDSFWRQALAVFGEPPAAAAAGHLIRFAGPPRSFPTVSYYQAMSRGGMLAPDAFRGRLVLVGLSLTTSPTPEEQQADMLATPFLRTSGTFLSGVEVHASLIEAARQGRLVAPAPGWAGVLLLALCLVPMALAPVALHPSRSAAMAGLLTLALVAAAFALFRWGNLFLPVLSPAAGVWLAFAGNAGIDFVRERAQRRFIRRAFGMYVSDAVIDHMLADPERLRLGGERRPVTFIFTDVSGFTAMTEQLDPTRTVAVLRDYFEGMTGIVFRHAGTLGQLLGDGMLLFFNAPTDQPDHALRAVRCALDLDRFATAYARSRQQEGIPIGGTRIGVNTGTVIVGNFGSSRRFLYTGIGDAINTASRLESANKFFGTRICVSAAVAAGCDGVAFRPIAEVQLKGKSQFTPLLEPLAAEAVDTEVTRYLHAYALLQAGQAAEAAAAFAALAVERPDDGLVSFHCRRLAAGETGVQLRLAEK